jgi:hypothetical protein
MGNMLGTRESLAGTQKHCEVFGRAATQG